MPHCFKILYEVTNTSFRQIFGFNLMFLHDGIAIITAPVGLHMFILYIKHKNNWADVI